MSPGVCPHCGEEAGVYRSVRARGSCTEFTWPDGRSLLETSHSATRSGLWFERGKRFRCIGCGKVRKMEDSQ